MSISPKEIAGPHGGAKPNHPIPLGVRVERLPVGHVNSPNEAGGYVDPRAVERDSKR
jgi:hypothetical protein